MTEPYLIAHLVRGQPAFDIAEQMECPVCAGRGTGEEIEFAATGCDQCNADGHWWIIPTSGHRAYPYWTLRLDLAVDWPLVGILHTEVPDPPVDWPDHYSLSAAPKGQGLIKNLAERLGFVPKPPTISRR